MRALHSIFKWLAYFGAESPHLAEQLNIGNTAFYAQDYGRAVTAYSEAIHIDPNCAGAYANRAAAYYARQQFDPALADYNAAIGLDPKMQLAYHGRGAVWLVLQDYDRAIDDYTTALRLNPRDANCYVNRGSAWYCKQDYDKALDDYSEAIHLDPKSAFALVGRGNTWLLKQEWAKVTATAVQHDTAPIGVTSRHGYQRAIDDYCEAIRLDPNYAAAFYGRGATWHGMEDLDKAIDDYCEAIRLEPKFALAFTNRAYAWRDKEQYARSIADYDEAMRINPQEIAAINGLAWLLATAQDAGVRDGKRAVMLGIHALALAPNDAATMDTLAVAYAEAGDFDKAIRWQEAALKAPPLSYEAEMRERLELFRNKQPYRQGKRWPVVTTFMQRKNP